MYTSIEKAPSYAPQLPDIAKAKKNIVGKVRQLLTAALGREFMELSTRHKVYGIYFCLSLIALFAWDESRHKVPSLPSHISRTRRPKNLISSLG